MPARYRVNRNGPQDCEMEGSRCSFPALSKLTPQDQAQYEANSERREYCFCWILTDVLLGIFLECPSTAPSIAPRLFGFATRFSPCLLCLASVFFRKSARG